MATAKTWSELTDYERGFVVAKFEGRSELAESYANCFYVDTGDLPNFRDDSIQAYVDLWSTGEADGTFSQLRNAAASRYFDELLEEWNLGDYIQGDIKRQLAHFLDPQKLWADLDAIGFVIDSGNGIVWSSEGVV